MTDKEQILKSAGVITSITILSRILGYLRDQRITFILGTSRAADAFVLAYRIPNLLRRLVGEGAMTAAFIPIFAEYLTHHTREEVWEFADRLFWTLTLVLAVLTGLGIYFSAEVIRAFTLLSPEPTQWGLAVYLNRIIFPYCLFICLAALASAILNSFHAFALPAATPIILNLTIIAASLPIFVNYFREPAVALAMGVVAGGVLQLAMQIPALRRRGMNFRPGISFAHPGIRSVGKLMLPGFIGIGIYQVNIFIDTIFASSLAEGSISSLYVADRVMELVLGGYAIAVATAILPIMSRQAAERDYDAMKKTFAFSLRIVSFITIPAAVGLIVLRRPIITVLFEHGQFSLRSTEMTAWALMFFSMGLPAFAAVKIIVPAFYSLKDTRTPVLVAAGAVLSNLIFILLFIRPLQNGGLALATALSAYLNFFTLLVILRHRFGPLGEWEVLRSLVRVGVASALMGGLIWLGLHFLEFFMRAGFLGELALLVLLIGAGTGSYLLFAWLLRCEELSELYGLAVRRRAAEQVTPVETE